MHLYTAHHQNRLREVQLLATYLCDKTPSISFKCCLQRRLNTYRYRMQCLPPLTNPPQNLLGLSLPLISLLRSSRERRLDRASLNTLSTPQEKKGKELGLVACKGATPSSKDIRSGRLRINTPESHVCATVSCKR